MKARRTHPRAWTQIDPAAWPTSENQPIAVIALDPEDLRREYGIEFKDDHDDLDSMRLAVLRLPSGSVVGLARYMSAPDPGTGVYAEGDAEPDTVLREIRQVFELPARAVSWSRS